MLVLAPFLYLLVIILQHDPAFKEVHDSCTSLKRGQVNLAEEVSQVSVCDNVFAVSTLLGSHIVIGPTKFISPSREREAK